MAEIKISGLPAASALDGTEDVPVVQAGETRKASDLATRTWVGDEINDATDGLVSQEAATLVIRPETYGAVGDGLADDSSAFQSMYDDIKAKIDAGDATHATVELGVATYLLAGVTCEVGNVTTRGHRRLTTVKMKGQSWPAADYFCLGAQGTDVAPLPGVVFENFHLDGNKSAHSGDPGVSRGEGLELDYCTNWRVSGVTIEDTAADGIDLDWCTDGTVTADVHVEGCDAYGIHVSEGSARNVFVGPTLVNNGHAHNRGGIDQFAGTGTDATDNVYLGVRARDNYRNFNIQGSGAVFAGCVSEGGTVDDDVRGARTVDVPSTLRLIESTSAAGARQLNGAIIAERDVSSSSVAMEIRTVIDGVDDVRMRFRGDLIQLLQAMEVSGTLSIGSGHDLEVGRDVYIGPGGTTGHIRGRATFVGSGSSNIAFAIKTLIAGVEADRLRFRGNRIESTQPFQFPQMSTTARDAITATNGIVIYNTTTNKLQAYAGGTWVDLHA